MEQKKYTLNDYKELGYRFIDNEVEFLFYPDLYESNISDEDIYITGSFNDWLTTGDASWKMSKKEEHHVVFYSLKKDKKYINIPGNSGFAEFRFFALSNIDSRVLIEKNEVEGFTLLNNKIILDSVEYVPLVMQMQEKAAYIKTLDDFDLSCPACRSEISNVRLVPGTNCLFRGYHPFKKSRPDLDTEKDRIKLVQKAFDVYGIKCDITLSGAEGADKYNEEEFPEFLEKIEQKENRLCVNIDYNLVYYHGYAVEYLNTLQKIAKFIIQRQGPYYIHCRLGSDRTGVTCAIFASLCGASWNQIVEDYEKTSEMGTGEFRNKGLLKYAFENIFGKNPENVKDLAKLVQSFFISENILKANEIEKLINRLTSVPRKKDRGYFDFTHNHICGKFKTNVLN